MIYGDRTGGPAEGVRVLRQAVKDTNLLGPDLVMTVGDLIQGYNDREPWLEQMREYRSIMDRLDMPWFPVAGNHDIYWRGPGSPRGNTTKPTSRSTSGPLWYAFEHKNCGFIVLFSDEGDRSRNQKGWGSPRTNQMSEEQLAWLKAHLRTTTRPGPRLRIPAPPALAGRSLPRHQLGRGPQAAQGGGAT